MLLYPLLTSKLTKCIIILIPFIQLGLSETTKQSLKYRNIPSILKESMTDNALSERDEINSSIQSEVRYKIVIDPSSDESLVRLLFTFGILRRQETRVYICSEFPRDYHSRVSKEVLYSYTLWSIFS